jgi:Zn-finger protein
MTKVRGFLPGSVGSTVRLYVERTRRTRRRAVRVVFQVSPRRTPSPEERTSAVDSVACEPKATLALVLAARVAAACRTAHARRATSKRVNVALLERYGEVTHGSMSLFTRVRSDTRACSCRPCHVCGATCGLVHVALHTCAERHAGSFMSLFARVRSDMRACSCRPSHVRGATCGLVHVALATCAERHAGLFMSPFTRYPFRGVVEGGTRNVRIRGA